MHFVVSLWYNVYKYRREGIIINYCEAETEPIKKNLHFLVPVSSGEERCAPNHSWGAGVRSHYLIHYVISGKGIFYCGTEKISVHKGQIFVIFPGTVVKYQADARDPWHYAWIGFRGDEAKEILRQAGITLRNPVMTLRSGAEAVELLRDMPTERSGDMKSNLRFSSRMYEFMSLLVAGGEQGEVSGHLYFTTATRYIKAHYFEDITVDRVAGHIGISRKYLFAIFKKELGISPRDYIIDYRVKRAKEFLMNDALTIGNIAYSVGYRDPLNFSKIFKLKTGLSPSEYRSRNLKARE